MGPPSGGGDVARRSQPHRAAAGAAEAEDPARRGGAGGAEESPPHALVRGAGRRHPRQRPRLPLPHRAAAARGQQDSALPQQGHGG